MHKILKDAMQDKEYCCNQLMEARKLFTNNTTTEKEYDMMQEGLALLYVYCCDEVSNQVLCTIEEAEMRKRMMYKIWMEKNEH